MSDAKKTKKQLLEEIHLLRERLAKIETAETNLLERAIGFSRNGIVIADAQADDMPLIYVNPAFETITGYSRSECIGRNCRFLQGDDKDQPELNKLRRAIREGRDCNVVLRNYRKDGTLFWNELYLSPIHDHEGKLTHFVGVQNEITARKRLEEAKEQFVQIASHDLKSPLAAIISIAQLLPKIAPVGSELKEEMHQSLSDIYRRGKEMQSIIEDYLDFQALEDGRLTPALNPIDLTDIVQDCTARNQEYARRKGVALSFRPDLNEAMVEADYVKLTQVAQNLIGNAIKFSKHGTRVEVGMKKDGGAIVIEVRDEGPGLTDADLKKVFSKYVRLSNQPTGGEKSSGLGLYICQKLLKLHSGEIGVRNNPERGTTFWFKLPEMGEGH